MEENIVNNENLNSNTSSIESNQNETINKPKTARKSGVELLKILAIFIIVLSHVVQTLGGSGSMLLLGNWVINFTIPGSGFANLVLSILRHSGNIGNTIFVVCSSWFLLDKDTSNKKKLLRIFFDVFVISIIYLIAIGAYVGFETLTTKEIIKSIFPNFFANNWFITYYFVFALLAPIFNKIIKSFNQQTHFIVSLVLFGLFFIIGFIIEPAFVNDLIIWVAIYFIVAYFKLYGQNFCTSKTINISLVIIGILGIIAVTTLTYLIGAKTSLLKSTIRWNKQSSPFVLFIAFGLLNLFNRTKFSSKFINYISSLSFLVYIIHENLLFRTYIRPQIWNYIYTNLGYNLLFVWIALFTTILFVASILVSALYNLTLQKLVHKLSDKIYDLLVKLIEWCQNKLIKVIK